jgi:hypothetical protein
LADLTRRRDGPSLQGGLMHIVIVLVVLGIVAAAIAEVLLELRRRG